MEHLVDHLRDDVVALIQREDTVIPEIVVKRSADMDEVELVLAVLVSKSRDDTIITVTDDRGVVSDCIHVIEFRSSLVPVSIHREIEQGA